MARTTIKRFLTSGLDGILIGTLIGGLSLSPSCATTANFRSIEVTSPYSNPQQVLQRVFTDEAYRKLKSIPIVDPWFLASGKTGFASSGNLRDTLAALVTGMGLGRVIGIEQQAIDDDPADAVETLIHEYIHQGIYSGLINLEEFRAEYAKLRSTESALWKEIEQKSAQPWLHDIIGISRDEERIALLGTTINKEPGLFDKELHRVYRRLLRHSELIAKDSKRRDTGPPGEAPARYHY